MGIAESLKQYRGKQGSAYIAEMHSRLAPLAQAFRQAVYEDRDREIAQNILGDIQPLMHGIAGATTKGEIPVFGYKDKNLDLYFNLHSIFRESRFRNSTL